MVQGVKGCVRLSGGWVRVREWESVSEEVSVRGSINVSEENVCTYPPRISVPIMLRRSLKGSDVRWSVNKNKYRKNGKFYENRL